MARRNSAVPFAGVNVLFDPGARDRLRLAWRLMRDPRVAPRLSVAVPVLTLLYVLSPFDLVPDFLFGAGQIDDLGAIGLAVLVLTRLVPMLAPVEVLREHRRAMGLDDGHRHDHAGRAGRDVIDADYRIKTGGETPSPPRAGRRSPLA